MLSHKTLLITGASHGIGKAAALFCAKQNATVILLASNERALEQCYDEIIALKKQTPLICTFNLESAVADDYVTLKNTLEQKSIVLDGLIHCAGQLKSLRPIEHTPLEQWHRLMQINTNARFALTQTLLPLLRKSEQSHLIFTLSDKAFDKGQANWGAYQVTEKANAALFEILKEELDNSTIKVNAVNAPDCNTKLRKQAFPFEENPHLVEPSALDCLWQSCFDKSITHGEVISLGN